MENIRSRLTFGNKAEDVKLRKRKSQLYAKDDPCPLNCGALGFRLALFVVAFRLINCFLVQSSFVPDEYWQSLEISHHMVFNYGYLTWEWKEGIRGYSYPLLFAFVYKVLYYINYDSVHLLKWLPRILQTLLAAFADVKFFFLVGSLENTDTAKWTFICHLSSWFTWYCCTRTLTNSMETTLTTLALCYFPLPGSRSQSSWKYLTLVALSVLVRPTALIVWFPLLIYHFWQEENKLKFIIHRCALIGTLAILISTTIDCVFYGKWTFVQFNFIKLNIFHGVADFYGSHPWHWYFTQGFPAVIGPHLPLFLHGCTVAFRRYKMMAYTITWTLIVYSLLPHKEFRFIYPVLPFCMIFCGISLASLKSWRRTVTAILVVSNLLPALYTGLIHQRGTLDVMGHLQSLCDVSGSNNLQPNVLFLMPCHSTPYYSHLHCPISMRFLECPPNLGDDYVDESAIFYEDPLQWLRASFPYKSSLPTHLVIFDVLEKDISAFLQGNNFVRTTEIFHTHFPEGRVGRSIFIYERH
ncbi:GPI mannosyltransferase 3 [Eucyclogobius newberryi]|uniref:GPI mannosyltransferase 3 n=1 Tax=Eucyclogobius newberryi TaxID=166745 RepID=UPI003B5BD894